MYVWFLLILISPMFFTPSVNMAQEKGKADQEAIFPAEVSGWKWDGKENHYNRKTIFDYINGAGELYIAYNFNGVKVRRTDPLSGKVTIIEVDLKDVRNGKKPDVPLLANDVISVSRRVF